jgi:hypothetical protein
MFHAFVSFWDLLDRGTDAIEHAASAFADAVSD